MLILRDKEFTKKRLVRKYLNRAVEEYGPQGFGTMSESTQNSLQKVFKKLKPKEMGNLPTPVKGGKRVGKSATQMHMSTESVNGVNRDTLDIYGNSRGARNLHERYSRELSKGIVPIH